MLRTKNQGQSTVEYLLVVTVASFFVLSLWVYMDPRLSSMLSDMEDIVAAKIRGGELVSHYKGGERTGGRVGGEEGASATKEEGVAGGREGEGSQEGSGTVGEERAEGVSSSRPHIGDLEEGSGKASTVATAPGEGSGGEEGASSTVTAQRGGAVRGSQEGRVLTEQKPEGKKEKATAEEDKSSKGRGILYQEGQEETAMGAGSFNWLRLILMLLIFIVVIFIAFEIYKSIKLSRK